MKKRIINIFIVGSYISIPSKEKEEYEKVEKEEPKDKLCFLKIMFFIVGIVSLMPTTFLVTANNVSIQNTLMLYF